MNKISKIICILLSLVFIALAAFHFDEPDFELWISIYFIASFIAMMVAFNKLNKSIVITAMIAYLVGAIAQWPSQFVGFNDSGSIYAEQAREAAGLFFCFLAMAYFVVLVIKKRSGTNKK